MVTLRNYRTVTRTHARERRKVRLSHSQVGTINKCGVQWVLGRHFRKPEQPRMSTLAGSVVHRITEALDKADVGIMTLDPTTPQEWKRDPYLVAERTLDQEIKWALERSDGLYTEKDIRISGRKTRENPHGFDKAYMVANIPSWVENWRNWLKDAPWQIWIADDGQPGIELGLTFELGGQEVRGSIDRVLVSTTDPTRLAIVDLKGGAWVPKDLDQPNTYRIGLQQKFPETRGKTISGGFYMNRTGKMEKWAYLDMDEALLAHKFASSAAKAEQGLLSYDTDMCDHMCSVRDHCPIYGGQYAIGVDEVLQGIQDAAERVRNGEDMGSRFVEEPPEKAGEAIPDEPPF
jgi:hypothetical protein